MGALEAIAAIITQAPVEPDPEIVTPGALGLAIVVALGVAVYFLYRSLNRQLGKVDFPDGEPAPPEQDEDASGDEPDRTP